MSNYISSNNNRVYAALEPAFGQAPSITAANRMSAINLSAHQQLVESIRRDKTGTRTFLGTPPLSRRATAFTINSYLSSWNANEQPGYGPLLQSAFGGTSTLSQQLVVASMVDPLQMTTASPHGLSVGSGLSQGSEIRFVTSVVDTTTILLNAPFSSTPAAGTMLTSCCSYKLGNTPQSVSLFDYWDPTDAVDRLVTGATVDRLSVSLNGAYHELSFSGLAADLLDSNSFVSGSAGLQSFPTEPQIAPFDYSIVAGNLGQAWFGVTAEQVLTLTSASVHLNNNLVPRNMEFGSIYPRLIAAGPRDVSLNFSLFADDSLIIQNLYGAAKLRTLTSAMFQLGQQQGQMMGLFLPSLELEIPLFDDRETRLVWDFSANIAQGTNNNEMFLALA